MSRSQDKNKGNNARRHVLIPDPPKLSASAKQLLERLRVGGNFSQNFPGFDSFTHSSHAEIFLDNAIRLCEDDGMSDFRVFGALYLLRHGLELMLKCLIRNVQMDAVLRTITESDLSFEQICESLWTERRERDKKRPVLLHALCGLRNRLEAKLSYPECHQENIDAEHAAEALNFVRKNQTLDRFYFAVFWPVAPEGHDLSELWNRASPVYGEHFEGAKQDAFESGSSPPLPESEIKALVELLSATDYGGDGLRYPSSITGTWYVHVPELSLQALGELAYDLKSTCKDFHSTRSHSYSMSTLGSPWPR